MTAILLLVLLGGGVFAYAKRAIHWVSQGLPAWWFIVGAPLAYFAPVVLLVSIWFALAWIWRTPRPPDAQLDFAGCTKLFLGEVLAVGVSWPLMALHRLVMRDPVSTRGKRPVILVHGVLVNDGVWLAVKRHLARGEGLAVFTTHM